MIEVILLFVVCGCFVAVNTHPKPDSDEEKCLWNNEEFIRSSFERTCSQQLLAEVKDVVDGTHDRVIHVDNASKVLQQELKDMREALASSTSTLVRRQNGFQKTVVEMTQVLRSCADTDDEVIASISRLLQQMSETQEKSANELEQVEGSLHAKNQLDLFRHLVELRLVTDRQRHRAMACLHISVIYFHKSTSLTFMAKQSCY